MSHTAPSRAEMIKKLVDHSIAIAIAESPKYWMKDVFEKGFIGYSKLSTQQLRLEMQLHGLDESADTADGADDDDQYESSLMLP